MPILFLFLLLFIGVPLVEIYLLIEVGGIIGAFPTVLAVVFTAVLGVTLIRIQGFSTLQKAQNSMNQGVVPAKEMIEGLMLLFAALCLLIPGFFTDAVGFLLLIPPFRALIASQIIGSAAMKSRFSGHGHGFGAGSRNQGHFFEGEYEDLTPEQQHQQNQERLHHQHIIEGKVDEPDNQNDTDSK
ncbi:MAG: FxsA family protein [Gammaproteobacteria bacterium]|nr:FxsA family protein [Gammaproteobacteria bacterium]